MSLNDSICKADRLVEIGQEAFFWLWTALSGKNERRALAGRYARRAELPTVTASLSSWADGTMLASVEFKTLVHEGEELLPIIEVEVESEGAQLLEELATSS